MSILDEIFSNPQPNYTINKPLYSLYISQCIADAQRDGITENELIERLRSFLGYLQFLNELNNTVVQEISDVSNQLYGEFGSGEAGHSTDGEPPTHVSGDKNGV